MQVLIQRPSTKARVKRVESQLLCSFSMRLAGRVRAGGPTHTLESSSVRLGHLRIDVLCDLLQ